MVDTDTLSATAELTKYLQNVPKDKAQHKFVPWFQDAIATYEGTNFVRTAKNIEDRMRFFNWLSLMLTSLVSSKSCLEDKKRSLRDFQAFWNRGAPQKVRAVVCTNLFHASRFFCEVEQPRGFFQIGFKSSGTRAFKQLLEIENEEQFNCAIKELLEFCETVKVGMDKVKKEQTNITKVQKPPLEGDSSYFQLSMSANTNPLCSILMYIRACISNQVSHICSPCPRL